MSDFIKEEGIFILGVLSLGLLLVGSSYAQQQGPQTPLTRSTQEVNPSVTVATTHVQIATSTPDSTLAHTTSTTAPSVTSPAPRPRSHEQEYDDD